MIVGVDVHSQRAAHAIIAVDEGKSFGGNRWLVEAEALREAPVTGLGSDGAVAEASADRWRCGRRERWVRRGGWRW